MIFKLLFVRPKIVTHTGQATELSQVLSTPLKLKSSLYFYDSPSTNQRALASHVWVATPCLKIPALIYIRLIDFMF